MDVATDLDVDTQRGSKRLVKKLVRLKLPALPEIINRQGNINTSEQCPTIHAKLRLHDVIVTNAPLPLGAITVEI